MHEVCERRSHFCCDSFPILGSEIVLCLFIRGRAAWRLRLLKSLPISLSNIFPSGIIHVEISKEEFKNSDIHGQRVSVRMLATELLVLMCRTPDMPNNNKTLFWIQTALGFVHRYY